MDRYPTQQIADGLGQDGFVALPSFVGPADIATIRDAIAGLMDEAMDTCPTALNDLGDGREQSSKIFELENPSLIEPRLKDSAFFQQALSCSKALLGKNARHVFDHAIDKPPYNDQMTSWHQDASYLKGVNRYHKRVHWWLPLQSVNLENGCMQFVRGSHQGRVQPHWLRHPKSQTLMTTEPAMSEITACPLNLGGATLHLPKTLHATGPNRTAGRRLAWVVHFGVESWRIG